FALLNVVTLILSHRYLDTFTDKYKSLSLFIAAQEVTILISIRNIIGNIRLQHRIGYFRSAGYNARRTEISVFIQEAVT
ncbi:hypothetical protein, partial [Aeromonas veronii]|uniref:hypothetical protein n=1 Tax=Aeromonas veronii TaxID=654 RepID=UPI003671BA8C